MEIDDSQDARTYSINHTGGQWRQVSMKTFVRIFSLFLLYLTLSCSGSYGFHKDLRNFIETGLSTEADLGYLYVSDGYMTPYFFSREYSYTFNTAFTDSVSLTLTEGFPGQTLEYSTDGGTTYVPLASGSPSSLFNVTGVYDGTLVIRVTNSAATNRRVYRVRLNHTRLVTFHEQRNDEYGSPVRIERYISYGESFDFDAPTGALNQDGITAQFLEWNENSGGTGASYNMHETGPIVTGQLDFYAQWSVIGGRGPGGGIVVYDDPARPYGFQYLEMAGIINGGLPIRWSNAIIDPITEFAIGEGKGNTDAIVAAMMPPEGASFICGTYGQNGFSDWFLPSYNELNAARPFLAPDVYIWTSTRSGDSAYAIRQGTDTIFSQTSASAYVRPFRSFN